MTAFSLVTLRETLAHRDFLLAEPAEAERLTLRSLAACLVVTFGVALVLFLRNPDPIFQPAFYGEDARWLSGILSDDVLTSYLHARRDYLTLGQTLLLHASAIVNFIAFGLDIANLPRILALASYLFTGAFAAVAFASLKGWAPLGARIALTIAIALMPLGDHANEVIGRVLNLGYLFFPLAVFLMLLRPKLPTPFTRAVIDVTLLVCAATNPLCIVLILAYLGLLAFVRMARRELPIRESLMGAAIVALCLFYIPRFMTANAVDMGEPRLGELVEAFGARSLLYPFWFPFYGDLNDGLVVVLTLLFFALLVFALRRTSGARRGVGLLLCSITLLLVVGTLALRPGLTAQLSDYTRTFPDRYFYAQNVLAVTCYAWATGVLSPTLRSTVFAFFTAVYIFGVTDLFEFSSPRMLVAVDGTFRENAARVAADNPGAAPSDPLSVPTYPQGWSITLPASVVRATAAGLSAASGRG